MGCGRLAAGLSFIYGVVRSYAAKLDIVQVQPWRGPAVNLYLVEFARVIPVQGDTGNALIRARIVDILAPGPGGRTRLCRLLSCPDL